ncbi:MAG: hypothetical protein MK291_03870 [Planctomycetes bacterium]|nr:hypothetical protein [Planctomycetota bacterium]
MRNTARLPFLLAVALCTPACFPALLGVGAGVVISHEVLENNTYVAQVSEGAALTWAIAKSSLTHQSDNPIMVDDDLRTATGDIGDANVTVSVETFDDDSCRLKVSARSYGLNDGPSAEAALHQILTDLNEARSS